MYGASRGCGSSSVPDGEERAASQGLASVPLGEMKDRYGVRAAALEAGLDRAVWRGPNADLEAHM